MNGEACEAHQGCPEPEDCDECRYHETLARERAREDAESLRVDEYLERRREKSSRK